MSVPFFALERLHASMRGALDEAYARVLGASDFILGQECRAFEREFAAACAVRHCLGVANGLDALALILRAMDIGPGDEVLVPSHTFIATWLAVSHVGATPVPVEPDPVTGNMDATRMEEAITPNTRAVIAVHLYGAVADMPAIAAVARTHGLRVIEDAAQAHGATLNGRPTGGLADAAAFSFYPTKNLGALGDGGAVLTNDDLLAARVAALRNYGSTRKYVHEELGYNSRLDELQAAFLRAKLPHLSAWNARRNAIARTYSAALAGSSLVLPQPPHDGVSAWHLYVVRHPRRDALQAALSTHGIGTMVHYPQTPHRQGAYASHAVARASLPLADRFAAEVLSLPMHPCLTDDEVEQVVSACRRALREVA